VGVLLATWVMDEPVTMIVLISMALVAAGTTLGAVGAPGTSPTTPSDPGMPDQTR